MAKKYWVHYYKNFGNTYNLYWTDSPEMEEILPDGAEQISRKKALELARAEAWREKYDTGFAMATAYIYPTDCPLYPDLEAYGYRLESGRIWVK